MLTDAKFSRCGLDFIKSRLLGKVEIAIPWEIILLEFHEGTLRELGRGA